MTATRLPLPAAERRLLDFLTANYPGVRYCGDLAHDGDDGWSFGARDEDSDSGHPQWTGYVHADDGLHHLMQYAQDGGECRMELTPPAGEREP
jgi:hypothetical protein